MASYYIPWLMRLYLSISICQKNGPKEPEFQNSKYEVHQVVLKNTPGANLAFKGDAVGVTQISSYNST
jgi:hypothetical protein